MDIAIHEISNTAKVQLFFIPPNLFSKKFHPPLTTNH
nr:MAG TPA: hypothetical protein [Caudoviricetes sp.]